MTTELLDRPAPDAPVPAPTSPRPTPVRRTIVRATRDDRILTLGCAANAVLVTWLLFSRLTAGTGWFGFVLTAYGLHLALLYLCVREQRGGAAAADRIAATIIATGAFALAVPFTALILFLAQKGIANLRPGFFLHDQAGVDADAPASVGGAGHAIVGSVQQVLLALAITLPFGLLSAVFLNETRSRWRRPVRILVDAMSGLPSIVAGLFIYASFVIPFASTTKLFNFNGFLAALALSITMLPTITRTVEVVLRLVPDGLREAALAMGCSRARMVWSVVLPTARTGVTTAVVLGIARAVGETAPLLFTSFGLDYLNANPFSDPQESLPLFIFRNIQKPSQPAIDRAFTAAFVLMIVVLCLFAVARFIGRPRRTRRRRLGHRRTARRSVALAPQEATA